MSQSSKSALNTVLTIDRLCDEFEQCRSRGAGPSVEAFLKERASVSRTELLYELLLIDFSYAAKTDGSLDVTDYYDRFPDERSIVALAHRAFRKVNDCHNGKAAEDTPPGALEVKGVNDASAGKLGRFELRNKIGNGGMGVVYEAYDPSLDRTVAIKRLRSEFCSCIEAVERFRNGGRAAARLNHPSIVQVYEVGDLADAPYLVMELVEGQDLHERIKSQPVDTEQAACILLKCAQGVQYAHEHGIVHRDLKPSNILLGPADEPRVADFGLAKISDRESDITREGQQVGTPSYMSPEQVDGRSVKVGPPSDVYSLGAILYYELTGRPPFQADTITETMMQVKNDDPVPLRLLNPSIPERLETICLKCLEKRPEKRYATAKSLLDDLERYLCGQPIEARPRTRLQKAKRWCQRHPVTFAITVGTLVACSAIVVSLWTIDHMRGQRDLAASQRLEAEARASAEAERRLAAEQIAATNEYHNLVNRVWDAARRRDIGWKQSCLSLIEVVSQLDTPSLDTPELRTLTALCMGGIDLTNRRVIQDDPEAHCLTFNPDGQLVAVGENRGDKQVSVRVYNFQSGDLIHEYLIPVPDGVESSGVRAVKFNPSGSQLVAATRHGTIHVWNVSTHVATSWMAHTDRVTDVDFSPDGDVLVSVSLDKSLKVWRCADWSEVASWSRPVDGGFLAFDPLGKHLALVTSRGLTLMDATSLEKGNMEVFERVPSFHVDVTFSPDSEFIAFAEPNQIFIRGLGRSRSEFIHALKDAALIDRSQITISHLSFADGTLLASGAWDHSLKLWDVVSGERLETVQAYGTGNVYPEFSPDGRHMATVLDGDVLFFSVDESDAKKNLGNQSHLVQAFAYSRDGSQLGTVAADVRRLAEGGEVSVWNRGTGQRERRYTTDVLIRADTAAQAIVFSPTDQDLFFALNGTASLWSDRTTNLPPTGENFVSLQFTADGKGIWAAFDKSVYRWSRADTSQLFSWSNTVSAQTIGHSSFTSMDHGPGCLVVGSRDGTVKMFDLHRQDPVGVFDAQSPVYSVAVDANKELCLSGLLDGNVQLNQFSDGDLLWRFPAHNDRISSIDFHPSERDLVATGSQDGAVHLWKVTESEPKKLMSLVTTTGRPVISVQFSPDGDSLGILYDNETAVREWNLDTLREELVRLSLDW